MLYLNTPSGVLKKKDPPSQKYEDLAPIAILVGSSVWNKHCGNECYRDEIVTDTISLAPSPHLQDIHLTAVASVPGYYLKQANRQKSLYCKHWGIRIKLPKLQENGKKNKKLRLEKDLSES